MELEFIQQAQKGFNDSRSYWIGGSTNAAPGIVLDFNSYMNGDEGN